MTMTEASFELPIKSPPQFVPDCGNSWCPGHQFRDQIRDWWPQKILAGVESGGYWQFYVRYHTGSGRHYDWVVCEEHHQFFLHMWETEYAWDVAVMEASDRWMSKMGI